MNFMVLGENTVKQGFSYENKEKNTELTLSANIASFRKYIITMDGEFSVDDGVYIFDENDGSKKSKFNVNFFFPLGFFNTKKYPSSSSHMNGLSETKKIEKATLVKNEQQAAIEDLLELESLLRSLNIPVRKLQVKNEKWELGFKGYKWYNVYEYLKSETEFETIANRHLTGPIGDSIVQKLGKKYLNNKSTYVVAGDWNATLTKLCAASETNDYKVKDEVVYSLPADLKADLLLKDYDAAVARVENLRDKSLDIEIETYKVWTTQKTSFIGFSPFYERQSLDIFTPSSTIPFGEMLTSTYGDAYGLRASVNSVWSYRNGGFVILRALVTAGRNTNISEYDKKEYSLTSIDPVTTISTTDKKTGYINKYGDDFAYGFTQEFNFEGYLSSKYLGIFGRIGYKKNEVLQDEEKYPFEGGLILNLKSDKKNVVGLLLFVSRQDLDAHPDDDLNFAFKIGLPIFISREPEKKSDDKPAK